MSKQNRIEFGKFLAVGLEAAQAAKELLCMSFRRPLEIRAKDTHFNLVTEADIACEKIIIEIIRSTFPDHNILAEEHEYNRTSSSYTWVIDPLDGTNNFAHRLPHYSVSIALACDQEVILGIVLDPEKDELFQATLKNGALLNGEPIRVTQAASLHESLFITGFYYDRGEKMSAALRAIERLLKQGAIDIRRLGSAALDLCYVACGRADGYFEFQLSPWDFAAGALILSEAGGRVTDYEGKPLGLGATSIVGTNGLVHTTLIEVIGE